MGRFGVRAKHGRRTRPGLNRIEHLKPEHQVAPRIKPRHERFFPPRQLRLIHLFVVPNVLQRPLLQIAINPHQVRPSLSLPQIQLNRQKLKKSRIVRASQTLPRHPPSGLSPLPVKRHLRNSVLCQGQIRLRHRRQ
jgi:hypothetical protein